MNTLSLMRLGLIALVALALGHLVFATAATNSIPPTWLATISHTRSIADLAPASCGARSPGHLISGSGTITGTSGDDLILGGPGADTIAGMGGDDCIIGGGGDDSLSGGDGDDACVGGPGSDTFDLSCEDQRQ